MSAWLIMAVNGALLGACCFLVAGVVTQIGSEVLEPDPLDASPYRLEERAENPVAAPSMILERNLFGAQLTGDSQANDTPSEEPLVATKLPLRLLGTAAANREARSRAAIEDTKTRKHMIVAVGDRLDGHRRVIVRRIERTRVVLDNAGHPEELLLHEDDPRLRAKQRRPARQARRTPRKVESPDLNSRLQALAGKDGLGISRILSSARIVPHYEDGKMLGMKVDAIKADSLFEKAGFQNGDIITEVNDIVIDNVGATTAIFDELSNADTIKWRFLRDNKAHTLSADTDDLLE